MINDQGVCRTAPATTGLLIKQYTKLFGNFPEEKHFLEI